MKPVFNNRYFHRRHGKKGRAGTLRAVLTLAILTAISIFIGKLGGNIISDLDEHPLKDIDTGFFKWVMERRLPIISTVYNSGNTSMSMMNEFKGVFRFLFRFEPGNPLTLINNASPLIDHYYNTRYLPQLAGGNPDGEGGNNVNNGDNGDNGDNSDRNEDRDKIAERGGDNGDGDNANNAGSGSGNGSGPKVAADGFIEDTSSITYEADEQKQSDVNRSVSAGDVVIQNQSKLKITASDIEKLLSEPLQFKIKSDEKGPKVLIYHTHTTEGYMRNTKDLQNDKYSSWTKDTRYSVVKAGNELANSLKSKYGISVLHNGTIHDSPDYNSSYSNSLSTVTKYLKSYPSLQVLIDVHRDAIGGGEDKLRPVTVMSGKSTAQLMFVVGTNGAGLKHPEWKENLKLVLKLQQKLVQKYPGIIKPVYISNNRYNQHLSKGSILIEVGGDGNTITESLESIKYLSWAINEVLFKK